MTTAATQHACQAGALFARRFYETYEFSWPDPTKPVGLGSNNTRTAGRFDTGSYTPQVQAVMLAEFGKAADEAAKTLPWVSAEHRQAWRDTANGEFKRELRMVAGISAPTPSAGPA